MKKLIVTLALLSVAAGAFAIDLSVGLGGSVSAYSNTYSTTESLLGTTTSTTQTINYTPFEATVFFDATYAQLSVGYLIANGGSITQSGTGVSATTTNLNQNLSYLSIAAYGKYPFQVGPVTLFPLLGASYLLNLTYTDSSGNNLKSSLTGQEQTDLNQLWLQGGAGVDISLGKLYLRPEILAGFKVLSTTDNNTVSALKNVLTAAGFTNVSASASYWTWDFSLMLGYKL